MMSAKLYIPATKLRLAQLRARKERSELVTKAKDNPSTGIVIGAGVAIGLVGVGAYLLLRNQSSSVSSGSLQLRVDSYTSYSLSSNTQLVNYTVSGGQPGATCEIYYNTSPTVTNTQAQVSGTFNSAGDCSLSDTLYNTHNTSWTFYAVAAQIVQNSTSVVYSNSVAITFPAPSPVSGGSNNVSTNVVNIYQQVKNAIGGIF